MIDAEFHTDLTKRLIDFSQELRSNPKPDKRGGALFIGSKNLTDNQIILVGEYDPQKIELYKRFAQEKAHRLLADWFREPSCVSSWQTRDEAMKRYQGAVLWQDQSSKDPLCNIVSFSGLAEPTDEAISLINGFYTFGQQNVDYVRAVADVSKNKVFEELFSGYTLRRAK